MNARFNPVLGIGMTSLRTRQRLVQRLRQAGICNETVLEVILNTPRHLFIEEALASRAYEDIALPIGFGQTISQPYIVALMTEALLVGGGLRKVLEIGTGSAYQTAILASLAAEVYSVERIARLSEKARERLRLLEIDNVHLRHGDGNLGWPENGPYDGIIVTAASQEIPHALPEQLAVGGRLVIPVGPSKTQELLCLERTTKGFKQRVLRTVFFVPLLGGVL
jgi:protein-L-isoaspartate(D-aspartate) O-methyltransferase